MRGGRVTPELLTYINGGYTSARLSSADMVATFAGAPMTTYSASASPAGRAASCFSGTSFGVSFGVVVNLAFATETGAGASGSLRSASSSPAR